MKLAIVGTRTFCDYGKMEDTLEEYKDRITEIISGGAQGADRLAEIYAKDYEIPIRIFKADWKTYGKRAGPMRNKQIVDAADEVITFWDGKSSGTKSTIDFAQEKGIPTHIILIS